ncbi:MAG: hypothetical protein QXU67_07010 [Candidatus Bathyarchaeia archaeon]
MENEKNRENAQMGGNGPGANAPESVVNAGKTEKIKLVVPIVTAEDMLRAKRLGYTITTVYEPQHPSSSQEFKKTTGILLDVPLNSEIIDGLTPDGCGYTFWGEWPNLVRNAVLSGRDVTSVIAELDAMKKAEREKQEAKKLAMAEQKAKTDKWVNDVLIPALPSGIRHEYTSPDGTWVRIMMETGHSATINEFTDAGIRKAIEQIHRWYEKDKAEREADERLRAEMQAARAKREKERLDWINKYGSEGLKERTRRGYNCVRRYIEERLKMELPGWVPEKWDEKPKWTLVERSCPSDTALAAEDAAKKAGYEARTWWAKWPADEEHEEEEGEVVVIDDYHGYCVYKRT